MPKITIEIETPDVDQLLVDVRELGLADDVRVTACSEVRRMNGSIVIQGSYPDHVNPDGLLVIFDLDGRTLPCSWLDVGSPPSRGSAIRLDSLNAGDGAAIVRAHGWLEHNLVMVYLDRVSLADAKPDDVARLRDIIRRAVEASDNDGGSASDAIQEMLAILDEAEPGEDDDAP